ncbi:hypothetical protein TEA_022156 [Camellia sinensis var. sinensis]|uniref:Pentacotripeptide-repeat region of PRORP domain-containing protein n=1 Tax=Camellia sinensis var. sinensis TaxID=542762 RepID=A0A4V3WP71_CAMSN|nr:hypothetical protein TEA_022156 [Camellia sinensis var. sinensis]
MSHKRYLDLLPGDVAIQLDLISEVHGVEQAEKYFSNIPITLRGLQVDGALLNCYAHEKSLEKAEAIMQKMTDLGFNITSLQYNVMLKLYADMGKHEKLDSHMQEMEEKGVTGNNFTFNTRLDAYAIASDIEGMEKLLMKMEADVTVDWDAYVVAANWYLRAGMVEKALPMVKKSERLVRKIGKIYSMGYLSMISSLVKLDDLDGAEKIWEEWNKKTSFDYRIPNFLINAYCKTGLLGNAESIVNRLIESVEMMTKALAARHSRWKPNLPTLAACVEYLKGKGSVEVAEELIELLREKDVVPSEVCERLVNYIESGNPASGALDLIMGGDDQALKGERGMRVEM